MQTRDKGKQSEEEEEEEEGEDDTDGWLIIGRVFFNYSSSSESLA
jgi:hypothetical protein